MVTLELVVIIISCQSHYLIIFIFNTWVKNL